MQGKSSVLDTPERARRFIRCLAIVGAVILLHGLAGGLLTLQRAPRQARPSLPPLEVMLLKPAPVTQAPVPEATHEAAHKAADEPATRQAPHRLLTPPPARPRTQAHAVPARANANPVPPPAAPPSPPLLAATTSQPGPTFAAASGPAAPGPAMSGAAAAGAPSASASGPPGTPSSGPGKPAETFALPPSVELHYDTFFNGVENTTGTLQWQTDGHTYRLVVALPLPFVGTFSYTSEGHVDAFGLAPDRYLEQRGRRAPDTSTFDRSVVPPHVSFTRTPQTVALPAGAQDRFSMIMQLASLVRGAPDRYQPGVAREFFVVDNDSGESWPIEAIGTESVQTRGGFIEARHFRRLPRHAGDERHIDIWLAPSLGWMPVRLVQTEPNGTQIELLWRAWRAPTGVEPPASEKP